MVIERLLLRVFLTDRIDICHGEVKIKAFHTRLGEIPCKQPRRVESVRGQC